VATAQTSSKKYVAPTSWLLFIARRQKKPRTSRG
jgi:hypothetical protein